MGSQQSHVLILTLKQLAGRVPRGVARVGSMGTSSQCLSGRHGRCPACPAHTTHTPPPLPPLPQVIEENKALLKQKVDTAKGIGAQVNDSKNKINEVKALIEQRRVQRSLSGDAEAGDDDPDELRWKQMIDKVGG